MGVVGDPAGVIPSGALRALPGRGPGATGAGLSVAQAAGAGGAHGREVGCCLMMAHLSEGVLRGAGAVNSWQAQ